MSVCYEYKQVTQFSLEKKKKVESSYFFYLLYNGLYTGTRKSILNNAQCNNCNVYKYNEIEKNVQYTRRIVLFI